MKRARLAALVVVIAAASGAGILWFARDRVKPDVPRPRTAQVVPKETRIRVEVLNATDTRGLARQAMFFLRDAGFDVVYFGNTNERPSTTVVRDRSGHPDWAALAAKVMAPARIEQKPDSSHFLDLSILVGRDWASGRGALYP